MISIRNIGRLGNNMWQYAVARCVAERNGYKFHIPRDTEVVNLFNCSLGENSPVVKQIYYETTHYNIQKFDPNIFSVPDNTELVGYFQCEKYIINERGKISDWFKLKNSCEHIYDEHNISKDACILHFRGGDYKEQPDTYLQKVYWDYSMNYMRENHGVKEFVIVTDDIVAAKQFYPELRVVSFTGMIDYYLLNKARYLIISNSTFSWWAAWLNNSVIETVAPKYWFRFNVSDGYWCVADSVTSRFTYVDRNGRFFSYDECVSELSSIEDYNYDPNKDIKKKEKHKLK